MDLDLRKLRYFVAVAEEEHFGRAADRLHITQPALSRQIRAFEADLGCALLDRTTRTVRVTPAGRQLHDEAASLLAAASAATQRVLIRSRGIERLVVGFAPGLSVSAATRAYAADHPEVEIEPLHLNWYEQVEAIRDGRADIAYLRGAFADEEVRTVQIGADKHVVCLPTNHPLSARVALREADLDGSLMPEAEARRSSTIEEKLERVAAGGGMVIIPESVARQYPRAGVVHRPVSDLEPDPLCLAVAATRQQQTVADYLAVAIQTLADSDRSGRAPANAIRIPADAAAVDGAAA